MATSLLPKGSVKPQRAGDSIRGKTVSMVENHLNKQRSAYDQWIAELCRDAEESAMERDRLKAKLAALREDHKRKVIMKIVGRLGNMQYYCAWSTWYNVTVKMHQQKIEKTIRELRSELESTKKKTEDVEAEAQRRADEAAKMSLGAASESQRKLILKIMTKLTQGLARLGWNQWAKQAFGHKMQQQKMKKIIKRLYNAQLNKGFIAWKTITQKWNLFAKLELKERLIKELADLEQRATDASDKFADQLHLILDPKALDKKDAPSYEAMLHAMGGAPPPPDSAQPPKTDSGTAPGGGGARQEQRIEEAKNAPPVVRNVERDVDMDSIRAVQAEIRSRPRQIKNRETPDWLKGTRDTTNDARPRFDGS
ncbi:mannosyl-oligosaccharide 1,2-alpha-mannosidase [Aureococcus anophagefferens]|nr:mannosyl-oligosaccharide 1,2-alpha-mannosidase [Aureococcus anophagefferens]